MVANPTQTKRRLASSLDAPKDLDQEENRSGMARDVMAEIRRVSRRKFRADDKAMCVL
jgi:hypothetical protein